MIFIDYSLEEKLVSFLLLFLVVKIGREVGLFLVWEVVFFHSFVAEAVDPLSPHHE